MHMSEVKEKLKIEVLKIERNLKLATHNPTIRILFKTVRIEVKFAFILALTSIVLLKLFPNLFNNHTFFFIGKDIWEKICYSIVASTVFYFINQHIPKIEKKVSCYHFEVNTMSIVMWEIKDLLDRLCEGYTITLDKGTSPETIYEATKSVKRNKPPITPVGKPAFLNWDEYLKSTTSFMRAQVNKTLPLHDALDRSALEQLFKVEYICFRIDEYLEEEPNSLGDLFNIFTDLMYCMVALNSALDERYKYAKAINDYRDKVARQKQPFRYAFEYKLRDPELDLLEYNNQFLMRLKNVTISAAIVILLFLIF
jgi:hypothetical protein